MIMLNEKIRTVDLPYTLYIRGVSEERFMELVDEDTKAELIDGVMIVQSPASPRHNIIVGFLRHLMKQFAAQRKLGQVFGPDDMVHLATCRKFSPDAFFLKTSHIPDPLPELEFEVVPDLVVEALSPSNRDYDLEDKRPAYRDAGVKEIWIIDHENEEIQIDRLRKNQYTTKILDTGRVKSNVIKGFWINVDWFWEKPFPDLDLALKRISKG